MPVVVVANPKGGVGKSTRRHQHRGLLRQPGPCGDAGRCRPPAVSPALAAACGPPGRGPSRAGKWATAQIAKPPKGTTHVVLDTPGRPARQAASRTCCSWPTRCWCRCSPASSTSSPRAPSSTNWPQHRKAGKHAGGHRRHARGRAHAWPPTSCRSSSTAWACRCWATCGDTQNYVHLAARGLTLFDVAPRPGASATWSSGRASVAGWTPEPSRPRLPATVKRMKTFETLAELPPWSGQEVAVSDWITITQEQVNQFAEATGDHQWIHVDVERAKAGPVRRADRARLPHAVAAAAVLRVGAGDRAAPAWA